jgi:hypothetical protein
MQNETHFSHKDKHLRLIILEIILEIRSICLLIFPDEPTCFIGQVFTGRRIVIIGAHRSFIIKAYIVPSLGAYGVIIVPTFVIEKSFFSRRFCESYGSGGANDNGTCMENETHLSHKDKIFKVYNTLNIRIIPYVITYMHICF